MFGCSSLPFSADAGCVNRIEEIPVALLEQQKVPGENTLIQHAGFLLSIRQRINLVSIPSGPLTTLHS